MFQNIVEEVQEKENKKDSLKLRENFKSIFKYQNLIIYILTFFLSMISLKEDFLPFGIAILAAALSSTIPIIGVFIVSIVATAISVGLNGTLNYIMTAIIYFILVLIFKPKIAIDERNELLKTGNKLYIAYFVTNLIRTYNGSLTFYNIFMSAVYAGLVYVFYKIFVNGLIIFKDFNIKSAFTLEELVGAAILTTIATSFFNNFNFWNINLCYIVVCFMIMLLALKGGILAGMSTGISLGLILVMLNIGSFELLGILTLGGILSGMFGKLGKIGSIVGFALGTIIITYIHTRQAFDILNYQNIIVASICLIFVSKKAKIKFEDLVGKSKLLTNLGENRLTENKEIAEKLNALSNTILENIPNKEEISDTKEEFVQNFLDNLEEYEKNILYEELSKDENIVKDIYDCIQEKEIIIEKDLITIFEKHNNYIFMQDELVKHDLQEIIKLVNRTYKMLQIDISKKAEKIKQQNIMSESLKSVSKAIDECAKEILDKEESKFKKLEQEIEILLSSKNINIKNTLVKQAKNKKYIIVLDLDINASDILREKSKIANISDILSKVVGNRISFQKDFKSIEKGEYLQTYSSEDKYIMQVGSAKISEENSKMSGDSNLQIRINDGKYVLAISDGMGTGKSAREKSKMAINTLKELLENGFEKQESVALINSMLNQKNQNESYTSMDITVLDLFIGKVEFMKNRFLQYIHKK